MLARHIDQCPFTVGTCCIDLGRDVVLTDGGYELIIGILPSYIRGRFLSRERLAVAECYRFVLGPPVSGAIYLNVYEDRFDMGPTTDRTEPDCVLTMDPQTYVLLLLGRLDWRQAIDGRTVTITVIETWLPMSRLGSGSR